MPEIVAEMEEPFCDIGINIATYILGISASQNSVLRILTGDGGDELFGGHPVYEADKIAGFIDPLPHFFKKALFNWSSFLPDTDKKKSLTVKLKRFAESLGYPKSLLTHRWRVYYSFKELERLLNRNLAHVISENTLFGRILEINAECDGTDMLGKALYSDYETVVDFYLRRNDLIRKFGVEVRFPLLDHELIEYCAKIPSDLKVRGWFDTKYILKKAMDDILPNEIVYREDKLGHSIPLKNWLRDDKLTQEFVFDFLSEETIRSRGWFNPDYVASLVRDHLQKRRNNSHRLWALAVLEMWLQGHQGKVLTGLNK
jgi:asparagine synthase (glutamine-hydrolysing)